MKLTRRHWGTAWLALASATLPPERAKAWVIPVEDVGRYAQMVQVIQQVVQLTGQLSAGLSKLRNAATNLGGGNLVDDILIAHRNITADLSAISYHIETVSTQFKRVFPDEDAVRDTPSSDVVELTSGWDGEIHQSALAAERAQTALSIIERNTRSVSDILERSKATTVNDEGSELAKLQALVQMLGVINSDLATLATTITTTERVNASLGGAEASEAAVLAERRRRLLRGHDDRERPSEGIDRRFLR